MSLNLDWLLYALIFAAFLDEYWPEGKRAMAFHIVSATMLLMALLDMPYSYYTLLRIVVTISAGVHCWFVLTREDAGKISNRLHVAVFSAIGILFNPIIPIYLDREVWQIIDVAVAVLFVFAAVFVYRKSYD